jgi:hypothetical protein
MAVAIMVPAHTTVVVITMAGTIGVAMHTAEPLSDTTDSAGQNGITRLDEAADAHGTTQSRTDSANRIHIAGHTTETYLRA